MSKEARELYDLVYANGRIREFSEDAAKGSTRAERGGFILKRVAGNEPPLYKIVEEVPNQPEPDWIDLHAWPARTGGNWDGALVPLCPPFAAIALASLPARIPADPDYRVRFWWHTHLSGCVTDPVSRLNLTGASHPWGEDLKDKGVVGLMLQFQAFPYRFRSYIIERDGKWFPLATAVFGGSGLWAANFDPDQPRDEQGRWTIDGDHEPAARRPHEVVIPHPGKRTRGPKRPFPNAAAAATDWAHRYAARSINRESGDGLRHIRATERLSWFTGNWNSCRSTLASWEGHRAREVAASCREGLSL
jgi:hypothetical protein